MTHTRKGYARVATVSKFAKRSGKEIENESERKEGGLKMGYIFAFCFGFVAGGFVVIGVSVATTIKDQKVEKE